MSRLNIRKLNQQYSCIPQMRHHEGLIGHGKMMHNEKSYFPVNKQVTRRLMQNLNQ